MSAGRIIFQPVKLGEVCYLSSPFDFAESMASGETISSQIVTASVFTGTDPNPSAIIQGSAAVQNTTQVIQLINPGVLGTIYEVLCTVTTSLGQTLTQSGYVAIIPDLP